MMKKVKVVKCQRVLSLSASILLHPIDFDKKENKKRNNVLA